MRKLVSGAAAMALTLLLSSPASSAQWRDPYPSTYVPIPSGQLLIDVATVLTGTGTRLVFPAAMLADGRIQAVGVGLQAPAGATIVDGRGKWVTPGIIDVHSHLGVYPSPGVDAHSDGNEASNPTTPNVWAEHSIWPQDPGFATALAGGVTTMQILPGSANLIGGRGVTVRNVYSTTYQGMKFPGARQGLKMACGENPKRVYGGKGGAPSTRMGNVAGYRAAFLEAQAYGRSWDAYRRKHPDKAPPATAAVAPLPATPSPGTQEDVPRTQEPTQATDVAANPVADVPVEENKPHRWGRKKKDDGSDAEPPPDRDLGKETLVAAMRGDVLVHIHCYRADEMATMLDLAKEFGFHIAAFHHGVEAYKIADRLAAEHVCGALWADWWGFKMEALDAIEENIALVDRPAGGCAIVHSDSPEGIQRLNQEAAKVMAHAARAGMQIPPERAIRWLTANPAKALGIAAQTGTLEVGKRADVVVWNRTPFSVYALAEQVYIDGARLYDRNDKSRQPASDFMVGQEAMP
jgi:imidazolonepropionase-like amidohydrolase